MLQTAGANERLRVSTAPAETRKITCCPFLGLPFFSTALSGSSQDVQVLKLLATMLLPWILSSRFHM